MTSVWACEHLTRPRTHHQYPNLMPWDTPFAFDTVPAAPLTDSPDTSTATPDHHSILTCTHNPPLVPSHQRYVCTPKPQCEGSICSHGRVQAG